MSEKDIEYLVIRAWGLACMVIGGAIGWQLHDAFQ